MSMTGKARTRMPSLPIRPAKVPLEKRVNPYKQDIPTPKDRALEFAVGDRVRQMRYGSGEIIAINPAGADYEVTVNFDKAGEKKIMAHLSKLILDGK